MSDRPEVDGFECPECKWRGGFKVTAVSTFDVVPGGTDGHGDVEWDMGSLCMCGNCSHVGYVWDFSTEKSGGMPYTLGEVRAVLDGHRMDEHHRVLMEWMLERLGGEGGRVEG